MAHVKIRHFVTKANRDGSGRYYWQPGKALRDAGWRTMRLPDNRAQAMAEAEKLNAGVDAWRAGETPADAPKGTAAKPDTIDAVIHAYKRDEAFTRLVLTTQRGYIQCLGKISAWAGDAPIRAITPKRVKKFYRAMKATPSLANATIRVLRVLLQFAISEDMIEENAAKEIRLIGTGGKGRVWSRDAIDAFVATADGAGRWSLGTAVTLNEWCGQRQGDVLRFRWDRWTCEGIEVLQSKRGAEVVLPVDLVPHLVARLNAEQARQKECNVASTHIIVNENTNQPYNEDTFRHDFANIREAAAAAAEKNGNDTLAAEIRSVWFMHLRHTAITRLAEAEVDNKLIATITGHALKTVEQIIDRYLVRTKKMARKAFAKRLEEEKIR